MSSEPAIAARNVSKVYTLGLTGRSNSIASILANRARHPFAPSRRKKEQFHALDDVSFDVAEGEVVGVIGKNGAGKSTLLKILSRITPPSSGHITMQGHVGSLLEVGTGFHPELTGLENIYLNGSILGMSKQAIDLRIDEIIDFAEVPTFLDTPVKRYSSGMRVRLAFAVAAHLEPEILIIDEVLSVGDYGFQAKCLDKMRSVAADDGRTVLYVSHNLVTVEHLCRRTLLLVDGKLAFDGPTEETIERYLHLFPRAERGDIAGVFDLATADRSMNESLRGMFKRLVLRPNGGQPSDVVRMGDSLQIEIDLEDLEDNDIVILVGSGTSETIFRITSRMRPLGRTHEPCKDETIVIDIPNVMLTPGEYHLTVSVWGRNAKLQDDVHHAAEFTVIPADVIGTGYGFSPRDGSVYVPFEWHLEPAVPPGQGAGVNIAADLSDL